MTIIAVCGPSRVGKTTICGLLAARGYSVVSASRVASNMYLSEYGSAPSGLELAEYGDLVLSSDREGDFSDAIAAQIDLRRNIVVDGLRSVVAIGRIRQEFDAVIVFVRRHAIAATHESIDVRQRNAVNAVDARLGHILPFIDLEINNDGSPEDACDEILRFVALRQPGAGTKS